MNIHSAQPAATTGHLLGDSPPMRALVSRINAVARSRAPVFITGETGTGKELCASAIHAASGRSTGPFIALNCGAISRDLLESELFGHVKGSFTGAIADRKGAAALAHGGTLFLDEICEMDASHQVKLLRFLQTGAIQPVGTALAHIADVRIICATNRSPSAEIEAGRFRQDLHFRLHVLSIHMPPLRERGADIIVLARHFLDLFAAEEGKAFRCLSPCAEASLTSYDWPGNIRELQNVLRQAVVLNDDYEVTAPMLSLPSSAPTPPEPVPELEQIDTTALRRMHRAMSLPASFFARELWQIERDVIEETVQACGGSVPRAAKVLGVSPSTLYRKRESWSLPSRH